MPDSLQALVVVAVAVLPGALFMWAFERVVGPWGAGLADRVLRFIGLSAILHALLAPVTYAFYRDYIHSGVLARAEPLPWWMWFVPIAFVIAPIAVGAVLGIWVASRAGSGPAALYWLVGQPFPRAWDHLFRGCELGYVRCRLKATDEVGPRWVAGWWGSATVAGVERRSRVARYRDVQDLYLVQSLECDARTGMLLRDGEQVRPSSDGLLIRWDEVEYLYFEPTMLRPDRQE
jgi:hypothetical protein